MVLFFCPEEKENHHKIDDQPMPLMMQGAKEIFESKIKKAISESNFLVYIYPDRCDISLDRYKHTEATIV